MLSCSSTCKSVSFQLPTRGLPDQRLQNRFGSSTSIYNPSSYVYGFDHNIKSHWNKVTKPARYSQVLFLFLFSVSIHQVFIMPSVCSLIVTCSFVKSLLPTCHCFLEATGLKNILSFPPIILHYIFLICSSWVKLLSLRQCLFCISINCTLSTT